ncbi:MAG: CHAT domain-containing protein [Armatimonadota bacterium]|nr:CHAT domain-containing protein [Armatimonadota bacterium]
MVPRELAISRHGQTYEFHRRLLVQDAGAGPWRPKPDHKFVDDPTLHRLLSMVDALHRRSKPVTRQAVLGVGRFIDDYFLPDQVREELQTMETSVVVVTEDPRIPWELAGVVGEGPEATCLGERVRVGRCLWAQLSARRLPADQEQEHPAEERPRALVIADPLEELAEARAEAQYLTGRLSELGWKVDSIFGRQCTYDLLFDALSAGRYRFVHLCCHLVEHQTGGAIPTSTDPLAAGTVANFDMHRQVVYLNACRSAVHSDEGVAEEGISPMVAGMAQAFIEAGASGVVGSLWKTEDYTSRVFAEEFYRGLMHTGSLGAALLMAKKLNLEPDDERLEAGTLSGFVLYGDPDIRIAAPAPPPAAEAAEAPREWPPRGWFDDRASEAVRRAALLTELGGGAMTSLHLGWALIADDDAPLASWMRDARHPLGNARAIAAALAGVPEEDDWQAGQPAQPEMSATVETIWEWVEEARAGGRITLAQLSEQFAGAGGGMMGELLEWLCIDLSDYPRVPRAVPLSERAAEAVENAQDTAKWSEGVVSSAHLLLGILEVGGGPLSGWLRSVGLDPDQATEKLREALLEGEPDPAIDETSLSINAGRILATARRRARESERGEVLIADIVDAAAELHAGTFGRLLAAWKYPGAGEAEGVPDVASGAAEDAAEAWNLAPETMELVVAGARIAAACGHRVVGTPHVVAAGLRISEPLSSAVRAVGYDPDQVLAGILAAMGAPEGTDALEATPRTEDIAPSSNLRQSVRRAHERAGSGAPLTPEQLLIAVLTQATGSTLAILQRMGMEPYRIVRALEEQA